MFTRARYCAIAGCLLSFAAFASSTPEQMAARVKESLARNSGYEMVSVQEFWGDASYLTECASKDKPSPKPVTIYFEVLPDGVPDTAFTRCIKPHVIGRRFTKPPGTYVTKIEMSFK